MPTAPSLPEDIPGPLPSIFLGRLRALFRYGKDSVAMATDLFSRYGNPVALVKGGGTRLFSPRSDCPGTILVYKPEFIKEVSTNHKVYHKFHLAGRLHPLGDVSDRKQPLKNFGAGLFGVNEEEHKRHRKLMAPAFYPQRVATYGDLMISVTKTYTDQWQAGETRNIAKDMQSIAKDIASRAFFGEDIPHLGDAMTNSVQESLVQVTNPWCRLFPYDLPGFPYRKLLDAAKQSQDRTIKIIQTRREKGTDGNEVLSMLLNAKDDEDGSQLTEQELIGHAAVLFSAGHETSANALTWTMFLLSQHPEITADLVDELQSELDGKSPTTEDLATLPFLEHVVKESLRIIPPVPWNGRITSCETELGGHTIPKGSEVMASIYHTHHMPELFAEPEKFNPRRWETIQPTGYEYNPFSAGQRICIGAGFAMQEIRLILAEILQRFRFELITKEIDRKGTIVIFPHKGLQMKLHPLDREFQQGVGGVRGNVREMVELP